MCAIIRQARANIRKRKLPSILTLVTLIAAAVLLTIALSALNTAQGAYDRLFERTNGAHLWLYLYSDESIPIAEIERKLANLPGVQGTTGLEPQIYTTIFVGDRVLRDEEVSEWPGETGTAHPLLVEGRAPLASETDTIVLDRNMATKEDIAIGDTVRLLTPDGPVPFTVIGFSVYSGTCPYGNCSNVPHYIAPGTLTALNLYQPGKEISLAIGLRLEETADIEAVVAAARDVLPTDSLVGWYDWNEIRSWVNASDLEVRIPMLIFCIAGGLSAGFLVANAVTGAVLAQTRQIGLLKAIGFTRSQVGLIYLIEYLGMALLASLLGLVIGIPVAMLILRDQAAKFGEAMLWPPAWVTLATPLGILVLTAIFTFLPVLRAIRLDTVAAIRTGQEHPRWRGTSLPRLALPLAMGIKDTLSHPLRSALTALGLGVAIFAVTMAFALDALVNGFSTDPRYGARPDGDLFLSRTYDFPDEEVQRLIAGQPDVVASYGLAWEDFQFPGEDHNYSARFLEGDLQAFEMGLIKGRMLQNVNEAVIGYAIAVECNLKVGDSIDILIDGQPATVVVTGIYHEVYNSGRMIMLSMDLMRRTRPDAAPVEYSLWLKPGADVDSIVATLTSASNYFLDVWSAENLEVIDLVIAMDNAKRMVIWLAVIQSALTILGVFNSVWMGIQERRREMALLKAVGMTPGQVVLSVLTGAGLIALCSYIVSLPIGMAVSDALIDMVGRSNGYGPLPLMLNAPDLIMILPMAVLVAMAGTFIPSRRAARMNTVAALRYE